MALLGVGLLGTRVMARARGRRGASEQNDLMDIAPLPVANTNIANHEIIIAEML
jgi:hypothetical protein